METQQSGQQINIDEEFKHLMPPLGKEAYKSLEASLLKDGCLNPIVLWEGTLIDGHNRLEICTAHDIPFETVNMEFASRQEAMLWIIEMQAGRRNLTPTQLFYYRGLHYRTVRKVTGNKGSIKQNNAQWPQNEAVNQEIRTSADFANKYHVSKGTILRDAKASEGVDALGEISQSAKQKVLTHEVQIGKKTLESLAAAPREEVEELAQSIDDGTYDKAKYGMNPEPAEAASSGTSQPEGSMAAEVNASAISTVTVSFNALLDTLKTGTAAQIKRSIRDCINMLEDMLIDIESL